VDEVNKEIFLNTYSKYQFFLFPFFVVIPTILIGYFVLYPQLTRLLSSQNQIASVNKKTVLLNEKILKLKGVDEEQIKQDLAVTLQVLPQDVDFANSLGIIQNLANQYQFLMINFQTSKLTDSKSLKLSSYTLSLDLLGPKSLLKRFVDSINSNFRLMKVARLEINTPPARDEATALITVEVFSSQIPTSIGTAETPLPEITKDDEELLDKLASTRPIVIEEVIPQGPRGKTNPFE